MSFSGAHEEKFFFDLSGAEILQELQKVFLSAPSFNDIFSQRTAEWG